MAVDWESFTEKTLEVAEVRLLGNVDMVSLLALQKLVVHEVRQQSRISAAVMISEHPPSITVGRDGNFLDLPADEREIESRSLKIHRVPRSGGTFLHQPGQLAIYIVVSLDEVGFSEESFVERVTNGVVMACRENQVMARKDESKPELIFGRHGIIGEAAYRFDDGITSFGVILNVSNRLDEAREFGRGLKGERISSLNAERVRPTPMAPVRSALIEHICEQIGYPEYHIHTGHPFLKRVSAIQE